MVDNSVPRKQCSRKEQCIHPEGSWLPATTEYFQSRKSRKKGLGLRSWCKFCTAVGKKRHRQKPEVRKQERLYKQDYDREYNARPEIKERIRIHRQKPEVRQRIREYDREYSKTPEQRARRKDYRERPYVKRKTLRRVSEYSKTENGRASMKRMKANRRTQKHQSGERYLASDIVALYHQQKGRCWYCQCELNGVYHLEHRVPLSRGGLDELRNITLSCPACNLSKYNKLPHEWIGRLL